MAGPPGRGRSNVPRGRLPEASSPCRGEPSRRLELVVEVLAVAGFLLLALTDLLPHNYVILLLALPFGALLWVIERERRARTGRTREAVTDPLTGLGNRRLLAAALSERLRAPAPSDPDPFLLVLFDLDGLGRYNNTFGHQAGDALLAHLGARLASAIGSDGTAYRLGGDEFCVLLPDVLGEMQERVTLAAAALSERGEGFSIGVFCGAVLLPHEASTPDQALQLAERRLRARRPGRPTAVREATQDTLRRVMQARPPELPTRSSGMAELAVRVGRRLGMTAEQIDELARAGELHDIGKAGLPKAILDKPGSLEPDEYEFVRQHPILGERILSAAPALRPVARIVRATHERWDGHGYPDRLGGAEIPLAARIIAACDAYEAITSERCYRCARSAEEARQELRREAGRQFDPRVVAAVIDQLKRPSQTLDVAA